MTTSLFAWKRLSDGAISQTVSASSRDALFEAAGFGAVETHRPIKGYLAVRVRWEGDSLVEVEGTPS